MSVVVLSDMLIKLKNQIIRDNYLVFSKIYEMEQVVGIEPTSSAWKAEVLPLNYTCVKNIIVRMLEQVVGIEPTSSAWKAEVLPLNYTCKVFLLTIINYICFSYFCQYFFLSLTIILSIFCFILYYNI